jgi:hypothetical protein
MMRRRKNKTCMTMSTMRSIPKRDRLVVAVVAAVVAVESQHPPSDQLLLAKEEDLLPHDDPRVHVEADHPLLDPDRDVSYPTPIIALVNPNPPHSHEASPLSKAPYPTHPLLRI